MNIQMTKPPTTSRSATLMLSYLLAHWRALMAAVLLAALSMGLAWWVTSDRSSSSVAPLADTDGIADLVRYGTVRKGVDIDVDVLFATPRYYSLVRRQQPVSADGLPAYLFLVTETTHVEDLPASRPRPLLRVNGGAWGEPAEIKLVADSPHHRSTMVRFEAVGESSQVNTFVSGQGSFELSFQPPSDTESASNPFSWQMTSSSFSAGGAGTFRLTWVSVLAVLAGLVAAMWPCLFQLTAFFIPALAGLSMQEARAGVPLTRRFQVVKAAFFFVLGFTLVYTAGGALIGFAAQRLGDTPDFYVWQRYAAIGGGIMIIILALRVAAKVRAPLVCKMPVLSRMSHSQKMASPFELMFAGLAFATGCMTCFGAAIVIAMVVYVGLAGSIVVGALTMFLFSLGMGIPLVLAAIAMAKVLPVLFRLEKLMPWMGLASSILMVGFAILLITGNYMALTEWVYQALPLVGVR